MQPGAEWPPELGRDVLDHQPAAVEGGWLWLPRRRPALGVQATVVPTLLFVLLGAALGPHGFNILTNAAVDHLQAVVWVALAVIGVFIGLGMFAVAADADSGIFVSGAITAAVTIATVAGGLYGLVWQSSITLPVDPLAGCILIGTCASVSAAVQTVDGASPEVRRAARLADLDDVPLLVLGVTLLTAVVGGSVALRLLVTIAAGGAIGLAGCLLFERASEAERGVFVTGAVLLLAGIGAYLGTSPLLSGCVAAVVWVRVPGSADRISARDLRTLQHPLVALLLIVAGAMVEWSVTVLWITGCTVILRFAAKLLATVVAAPLARVSPSMLAVVLLQPGIMGIALAVSAGQLLGGDYDWLVSSVTVSAVVSEVLAAFMPHDYEGA